MAKLPDRVPRKLRRKMQKAYRTIDSTVDHEGRRNLESLLVYLRGRDVFLDNAEFRDLLLKRRAELFPTASPAASSMVDFFVMFEMLEHTAFAAADVGPRTAQEQQTMDSNLDHMTASFNAILPSWADGGFELIRSLG